MSDLEELLAAQLASDGAPMPEREFSFTPKRRWRFDFAWPTYSVAVEVEGATWISGRHSRGKGIEADCEKYNAAALDGWIVLRFTADMVKDGQGASGGDGSVGAMGVKIEIDLTDAQVAKAAIEADKQDLALSKFLRQEFGKWLNRPKAGTQTIATPLEIYADQLAQKNLQRGSILDEIA